jgi:hypothetical protein
LYHLTLAMSASAAFSKILLKMVAGAQRSLLKRNRDRTFGRRPQSTHARAAFLPHLSMK